LFCRDGRLLCFSGSAPLLVRRCIMTIHDAAIYLQPQAYSRKFVAWYRLLFSRISRSAPLVLTVSNSAARDLGSFLPGSKFRLVYNAAEHITQVPSDPSVLHTHALVQGGYILAVGSMNPTKNFAALIEAYRAAGLGKEMPLVIVGAVNGSVFSQRIVTADADSIVWAGSVSDAQLRALYEHAAVFAFPSLYEGFGIPPLEAMSCGCPVVASNASSIPEVCGDAALYFPPQDGAAIGAAILRVLADAGLRRELVEKGLHRSRCFSWEKSGEQLRNWLVEADYLKS
jgi:glycosyltransferase involved in cell wall biosynthesis